jgi:hypothetical protein
MDDGVCPDFADNSKWYNIKILTVGTQKEPKKELQKRTYTDPMRKIFKKL